MASTEACIHNVNSVQEFWRVFYLSDRYCSVWTVDIEQMRSDAARRWNATQAGLLLLLVWWCGSWCRPRYWCRIRSHVSYRLTTYTAQINIALWPNSKEVCLLSFNFMLHTLHVSTSGACFQSCRSYTLWPSHNKLDYCCDPKIESFQPHGTNRPQ